MIFLSAMLAASIVALCLMFIKWSRENRAHEVSKINLEVAQFWEKWYKDEVDRLNRVRSLNDEYHGKEIEKWRKIAYSSSKSAKNYKTRYRKACASRRACEEQINYVLAPRLIQLSIENDRLKKKAKKSKAKSKPKKKARK